MTMDINNRKPDIKSDVFESRTDLQLPVKTKRSFDVAFLMLPDEKLQLKQRELQLKVPKLSPIQQSYEDHNANNHTRSNPTGSPTTTTPTQSDDEDEEIEVDAPKIDLIKLQTQKFYTTQKQQIFGDPQIGKPRLQEERQKSAFTKVTIKEGRLSPNLSMSPDPSYQNSLSPSPPIPSRGYFQAGLISPNVMFKNHGYQGQFVQIPESFQQESNSPFILKAPNPELLQPNFTKLRTGLQYPGYNYQFQTQEMLKMAQAQAQAHAQVQVQAQAQAQAQAQIQAQQQAVQAQAHAQAQHHQAQHQHHSQQNQSHNHQMQGNPAAALLTSLLPPSLAALSLPAQNVCAKCNISFRMTSDLVYHMRSHHKNEQTDYGKRKREDKLKCPVCAESFRERHHLTRHMTAHQDKANDSEMPGNKTKKFTFSK